MSLPEYRVKIPKSTRVCIRNIRQKRSNGETVVYQYVAYVIEYYYSQKRKRSAQKNTTIGRVCEDDPTMMIPGKNFDKYFPKEAQQAEMDYKASLIDQSTVSALADNPLSVLKSLADKTDLVLTESAAPVILMINLADFTDSSKVLREVHRVLIEEKYRELQDDQDPDP